MVKMVLGSSDSQATSVAALADSYTAAFESLISAFDNLANEDKLSGSAYTNIKSYGSSVVAPLVKAFILLADAAKADVQKLPDEYRAQVGGEDLDEETLTAQISAYATTIEANQTSATSLGKTEPMTDAVQASINSLNDAVASDTAAKAELEEKLRKLLEYNAQSSGFFSDIASLESAVTTGISQLQAGVTSFNGTFTLPSKKDLAWTKTVNSQWEEREAYLEAVDKVKKGKALKAKDVKAIERYQKKHPNVKLDKTVEEAQKVYRLKKNYKAVVAKVKDGKTLTAKDIKAIEAYQKAYPKAKLDADVLRLKKLADFKRKVDQMDPQTFKKTYKEVIRKYDSHDYTGLDANDLYVIERYKKIKNTPEYQAIPEPKVSKAFKKEVDGLSLKELKQAFPYLWHPVPGNQLSIEGYFQSETERQKELYVINRYYELLAKEPVSERSPTFMQDYVAYVNQTGLNPFTGKKASDDVTFMAKHYHTVQAVNTFGLTLTGGYMDYVGLKSGVSAAAVSDDVGEVGNRVSLDNQKYSQWNKYAEAGLAPADRVKLMDWDYAPEPELYQKYKTVFDNPKYYDQMTGSIYWPENDGFSEVPKDIVLESGVRIDRYGSDYGSFVSPEGVPYNQRAVAPGTDLKPYSVFEVVKPIKVKAGVVTPWFNEPGGGTQYLLPDTVDDLLDSNVIKRIE
ncbi:glycohydrolase toxin TNT-related protein [Streptococcus ferus]|uniref:glycohydrolase toxin TNT-related protein n=1 Tax=Streptococcus ferus TaxID=1345 RepID=UPI002353327C|nr:glycohydrolase toxin TNT-related protein [Streptococcus ferus]